jgi:hypothetical protein
VTGYLHITNGDAAANILKASGLEGDVLPWRDPMHHGPFVAGLDLDAVSDARARYLSEGVGAHEEVTRGFRLRNEHLKAAGRYREVILWFEHDLSDQLQILQLLDWFSDVDLGATKLSMICIDRFPTIEPFRGLGQLNCEQMAGLYPLRQAVTQAQLALAKAGWASFRSSDLKALETFLEEDLGPLPFLRAALARHFEEYPWSIDGLTRTERQILNIVSHGISGPGKVFATNMGCETALFEGDLRTFQHIADLCGARKPLLHCKPDGKFRCPPDVQISRADLLGQKLFITNTGEQVLLKQLDATSIIERDDWLGGVHLLTGQPMWMWDPVEGKCALRRTDL